MKFLNLLFCTLLVIGCSTAQQRGTASEATEGDVSTRAEDISRSVYQHMWFYRIEKEVPSSSGLSKFRLDRGGLQNSRFKFKFKGKEIKANISFFGEDAEYLFLDPRGKKFLVQYDHENKKWAVKNFTYKKADRQGYTYLLNKFPRPDNFGNSQAVKLQSTIDNGKSAQMLLKARKYEGEDHRYPGHILIYLNGVQSQEDARQIYSVITPAIAKTIKF